MRVIQEVDEQRRLGIDTDNSIQLIKNYLVRDKEEGKSKRGIKQESRRGREKLNVVVGLSTVGRTRWGAAAFRSARLPKSSLVLSALAPGAALCLYL